MRTFLFAAALVLALLTAGYGLFKPAPAIRNTQPIGESIVCFGDSLTYGTGAGEGMDYPSQLAALLGMPVINKGIPGDTTSRALARLDRDVLALSPRIVFLTLGGNDLKNGVSKATAFRNLEEIVTRIQENGALVVIGAIDLPLFGRGFGDAYRALCEETGAILVPDIYAGIMGNPGMMSDQIHPNDKGYAAMARHFYHAVKPYVQ
ncbi:Lipolytic enzyme, G-D-S-L family [uncultured Desulfatiglans sp.]|uniref:Lipolytic enzyme, G-D-S-L family n=1 Tax=Uncultured Desulfatiglans sp. TaxID=1748965 RepID=A0A653A0E2_UNCDX|nr:Lipolytic enzyme, G-D-S-L family [uncultured Desulfatiglans sp.]